MKTKTRTAIRRLSKELVGEAGTDMHSFACCQRLLSLGSILTPNRFPSKAESMAARQALPLRGLPRTMARWPKRDQTPILPLAEVGSRLVAAAQSPQPQPDFSSRSSARRDVTLIDDRRRSVTRGRRQIRAPDLGQPAPKYAYDAQIRPCPGHAGGGRTQAGGAPRRYGG
jgi:hypothetical protein